MVTEGVDVASDVAQEPTFKGVTGNQIKILSKNGEPVPEKTSEINPPPAPETPPSPPTPKTVDEPEPLSQGDPSKKNEQTPPTDQPPTQPEDDVEEVDFFQFAAQETGGAIQTPDDVFAIYEENRQLKEELSAREQQPIEFPSEGAKKLYDYCLKFPGQEMTTARGALHVLSLDVDKLSDKEAQFEAFALKNKKLARDEARRYFEARYEKNFGDTILEEDINAQFDHKVQTEEARETLKQIQEELSAPAPSHPAGQQSFNISPEDQADIDHNIQRVLTDFGGLRYQAIDGDPNSVVSVPIDEADIERFDSYLRDPNKFFTDIFNQCLDQKGVFDFDAYALKMYELTNAEQIRAQSFSSGVKYGELKYIMEKKNTAIPTSTGQPASSTPKEPESFKDAMKQAILATKQKKVA